jgi:hypothetical protein
MKKKKNEKKERKKVKTKVNAIGPSAMSQKYPICEKNTKKKKKKKKKKRQVIFYAVCNLK